MELKTYYDFALDDYNLLMELKKKGIRANSIGATAQNTCERFLKHLINVLIPVTEENRNNITEILSTHNLNRLVSFWNSYSDNKIPATVANQLKKINGYYFSTKYPGDDCQTLSTENINICFDVIESCKSAIDMILEKQTREKK